MIVIIDYEMGNVNSIQNMLRKAGADSVITSDEKDIEKASKIILPGVGAFDTAMEKLNKINIIPLLRKRVIDENVPILGICLGMQLLTKKSEEGTIKGLGFIDAETVRFNISDPAIKVPHMGWNIAKIVKMSPLFKGLEDSRFYFVHSYHVVCKKQEYILTTTEHGIEFVSSFQNNNIFGVQFHPEKSHKFGLQLLKNFVELI